MPLWETWWLRNSVKTINLISKSKYHTTITGKTPTNLLVSAGIDVTLKCKHGSTPLNYEVAVARLDTQTLTPLYLYLLEAGSPYSDCIELANRSSWRKDFLNIVK